MQRLRAAACRCGARLARSHDSQLFGGPATQQRRHINEDRGSGEMEALIERSLVKPRPREPGAVLTTRRDALSLYRAVLRASLLFVWRNERGEPWRDVIRSSARTEFEATRCDEIVNTLLALFLTRAPSFLNDPEQVNRLLLTGRDCLDQAVEKFMQQRQKIIADEEAQRVSRERSGTRPEESS